MLPLRVSQAGEPAPCTWRQTSLERQPCKAASQGGDQSSLGGSRAGSAPPEPRAGEDPALAPAPHLLRLQGAPCLCTPSPNSPWRPQGGKMKSGRSKAVFKRT